MSDPFSNQSDPFLGDLSSATALTFDEVGTEYSGTVIAIVPKNDTFPDGTAKTWPNGDPMKVWIFTLAVGGVDGGERSLWVRNNMVTAIKQAAAAAGLKTTIGSYLTIQHHGLGEKKPGKFPAKLFRAKFSPAPAKATAPAVAAPVADEVW